MVPVRALILRVNSTANEGQSQLSFLDNWSPLLVLSCASAFLASFSPTVEAATTVL